VFARLEDVVRKIRLDLAEVLFQAFEPGKAALLDEKIELCLVHLEFIELAMLQEFCADDGFGRESLPGPGTKSGVGGEGFVLREPGAQRAPGMSRWRRLRRMRWVSVSE
jgi:hypothetical protein